MKELIKVTEEKGNQLVNARDLHLFLEVKTSFADWIKRMLEYGFEENEDYSTNLKKENRQTLKEYALTLDTAKEISMLQRSDKGKQARKYFIDCEKKMKSQLPSTFSEALRLAADQAEAIEKQTKQINTLKQAIETQTPLVNMAKSLFSKKNEITVSEASKLLNIKDLGPKKLVKAMKKAGLLMNKPGTEPYQKDIQNGKFSYRHHESKIYPQCMITYKGLMHIDNKLCLNKFQKEIPRLTKY